MDKQFFILIGRSGAGKGAQAKLLQEYLLKKGHSRVVHTTTGGGFRDFIARDNYVASLAREYIEKGKLQPEFLAVWNWSNIFINTLTKDDTVILDGAPRKSFEVKVLHSAITFFGFTKPIVIHLDVSESTARAHMAERNREDDEEEGITARLSWFETEVLPALDLYINDPRYHVIHVNGNQSIEDVHHELIEKLEALV
jgi:adenylate kinase family enzyme